MEEKNLDLNLDPDWQRNGYTSKSRQKHDIRTCKLLQHWATALTTGSRSLLLGTSIQVISTAPGVPGEQGVNRSCSIMLGSSRPGPTIIKISGDF